MSSRVLTVVHNNIDGRSAIGALARWAVEGGLERGWHVRAVCRDLDQRLRGSVEHRALYVPPRSHLVQWSVARPTVRAALRGTTSDALLTYQPQIAAIADVWHVQFLSRVARDRRGPAPAGARARLGDVQAAGVAAQEDRYIRRIPSSTRLLFCSDGLRDDFTAAYGPRENAGVLYNAAFVPVAHDPSALPDPELRRRQVAEHPGPVLGFLGGADPRKGGDFILAALAAEPELFLLHAGPRPLDDSAPNLRGRTRSLGHLTDVTELLDAVDVLMVPSRFEPFGMVAAEAAARGVPVIVGEGVGAAPLVIEVGAGAVWRPPEPLLPIVQRLVADRAGVGAAGRELAARLAPERLATQLFADLDAAAERNAARR